MKQTILITLLVAGVLVGLVLAGELAIASIGLGVIILTAFGFTFFALGARWTRQLMQDGARIAIESASRNDQHDATKIRALADLTREAIKARQEGLPAGNGYRALLPFEAVEGDFTIAGLEEDQESGEN